METALKESVELMGLRGKVVYLAGKMTGLPLYNFPAFDRARDELVAAGARVISPADIDRERGFVVEDWRHDPVTGDRTLVKVETSEWFDRKAALRRDFAELLRCDAVVMLPGWEDSAGATLEQNLAHDSGIPVYLLSGDGTLVGLLPPGGWWVLPEERVDALDGYAEEALAYAQEKKANWQAYAETFPDELAELEQDEIRVVNEETGGEKGQKLARFDLIPAKPLWAVAEHYGKGARKYADRNWERGYAWSLSIGALERHLNLFKQGETLDEETGSPHLAAVVFHALALLEFSETHPELDDRGL